MTTSTALLGKTELRNIVIGASRAFVAPYSTGLDDTVRFNTAFPPDPFLDLGNSDPNTTLQVGASQYNYMIGLPKVIKDKKVITRDASISLTLDEFSGANLSRALYNTNFAYKNFFTTPAIQLTLLVSANVVQLTSSVGFVVNQWVALDITPSALSNSKQEYKIVEINGNYLILDRDVTGPFLVAGATVVPYIGMIKSWKVPYGSAKANELAFVLVFENTENDGQMILHMPTAVTEGNFQFSVPATEHAKLSMVVTGIAYYDLEIANNSCLTITKFAN